MRPPEVRRHVHLRNALQVPDGAVDFVPPEWEPLVADAESIIVEVLLEPGDPPTVTATANGHSVVYVPATEAAPGCD